MNEETFLKEKVVSNSFQLATDLWQYLLFLCSPAWFSAEECGCGILASDWNPCGESFYPSVLYCYEYSLPIFFLTKQNKTKRKKPQPNQTKPTKQKNQPNKQNPVILNSLSKSDLQFLLWKSVYTTLDIGHCSGGKYCL